MSEEIDLLRKDMASLRTEFKELKQVHLDINRRCSESLVTLRGLTQHATDSAEKATSAAAQSVMESAATAASTAAAVAMAEAHHAEDTSAQGSAVAAAFAAKAVMLSYKAAEYARSARRPTS